MSVLSEKWPPPPYLRIEDTRSLFSLPESAEVGIDICNAVSKTLSSLDLKAELTQVAVEIDLPRIIFGLHLGTQHWYSPVLEISVQQDEAQRLEELGSLLHQDIGLEAELMIVNEGLER